MVTGTTGDLVCSWKESGLGISATAETGVCSASASATYACVTKSGAIPAGAKKLMLAGPLATSNTLTVGTHNGQATFTIVLNPPSGDNLACPNGQTLELAGTSYTSVVVADATAGILISMPVAGTFTSPCLLQGGC
jgi:hypothetical protein